MNKLRLAAELFDYLYLREPPRPADAIIGFGHFDPKIPRQCAELYLKGYAPRILFTGGIGAGSTGLVRPESEEFLRQLTEGFPQIPAANVIVENRSTNTGENLRFTAELLARDHPQWQIGQGIKSALLVANAYRQRRVWLTAKLLWPTVDLINCPPVTDFALEEELFRSRGEDLYPHIVGEMKRIFDYPEKGFCASDDTPAAIRETFEIFCSR